MLAANERESRENHLRPRGVFAAVGSDARYPGGAGAICRLSFTLSTLGTACAIEMALDFSSAV